MKILGFVLLLGAVLPLAACSSYEGGSAPVYSTGYGAAEGKPEPAASPTFRPGMNQEDPRDPHFTTRPETQTPPQP